VKKFLLLLVTYHLSLVTYSSRAYLLCQSWSYSGGWVQSSSAGWGNTYNWWGSVVAVPATGLYKVTTEVTSGDDDGDWWRPKSQTDYVWVTKGNQVAIYGTVKQSSSNNQKDYYVYGDLCHRTSAGANIQCFRRTTDNSGCVVTSKMCYPTGCQGSCYPYECGEKCTGANSTEDIDRARSKITVVPAFPNGQSRLW